MKNGLIIDSAGTKKYYYEDKLHRTDGPAVEWSNGDKEWWFNNKKHRLYGPAVECNNGNNGYKMWYLHGQLHRIDGPAIERSRTVIMNGGSIINYIVLMVLL